jgi:hypothetical protein
MDIASADSAGPNPDKNFILTKSRLLDIFVYKGIVFL